MGPAAICSAGTDTYRPGALCTDSAMYHPLVVWSRGCASLANVALCYRRRYVAVRADMYRRQRYTSLPDRYVAPAICTASLTDMKQGRYVAPQPVICSALGAISAVCTCSNAVLAAEASSQRGTARTRSTSPCAASRSTAARRRRRLAATSTGEAAGRRCRSMRQRFAAPAPLLARRR